MIKRKVDKFWFPWWPDKWIFGSIRIECTPEERGIWVDLLSLASKDDGHIRANEEIPYPIEQLSGMLMIPQEMLRDAIEKFINLKDKEGKGKLTRTKEGTLYVTKWEEYQLSRTAKFYAEKGRSEQDCSHSEDKCKPYYNKLEYNKLNYNKEEKTKTFTPTKAHTNITIEEQGEISSLLADVVNIGEKKIDSLLGFLKELSLEFPDIDYVEEIKKKVVWWRDHPLNKKSNIHLQLRNWFAIATKFQKEGHKEKRVGESTHIPSIEEDGYTKARAVKMKQIQEKYQPEIDKATKAHAPDWLDEIDNKIKEEIAEFSREYNERRNK